MNTLNIEEQNLLESELLPGESVTWSGKLNPHIIFHPTDWYVIPFSPLWGGFAIFWEPGVGGHGTLRRSKPSWFMMLWGVPFVVIGQYFVWGRFLLCGLEEAQPPLRHHKSSRNRPGKAPQAKTISAYLEVIPSTETTIRLNGIGTLLYGQTPPMRASGRGNKIALIDGLDLSSAILVCGDVDDAATTSSIVARVRDQTGRSSQ